MTKGAGVGGTPPAGAVPAGAGVRVPPWAPASVPGFRHRAAPALLPAVVALAWLALAAPSPLSAQGAASSIENHPGPVVTGEVVDLQTRRPVPNAAVRLVTAADSAILGAGWTDQAGRYVIPLFLDEGEDPGALVVEAGSLGYVLTTSGPFRLRPGRVTAVPRISLRPEPMVLDTIAVAPERRSWTQLPPPRELVRRRQLEGRGIFIPGAMVENASARSIPEFLADRVDGLEVEFTGGTPRLRTTFYPRCIHVLVNEWPPTVGLDRISGRDVGALEVYRTWSDVPENLRIRIAQLVSLRRDIRCTVVNVWLWNVWNVGVDPGPGS